MEDNRHKFLQLRFTDTEYERLIKLAAKLGYVSSKPDKRRDRTKLNIEIMINTWAKEVMEESD